MHMSIDRDPTTSEAWPSLQRGKVRGRQLAFPGSALIVPVLLAAGLLLSSDGGNAHIELPAHVPDSAAVSPARVVAGLAG